MYRRLFSYIPLNHELRIDGKQYTDTTNKAEDCCESYHEGISGPCSYVSVMCCEGLATVSNHKRLSQAASWEAVRIPSRNYPSVASLRLWRWISRHLKIAALYVTAIVLNLCRNVLLKRAIRQMAQYSSQNTDVRLYFVSVTTPKRHCSKLMCLQSWQTASIRANIWTVLFWRLAWACLRQPRMPGTLGLFHHLWTVYEHFINHPTGKQLTGSVMHFRILFSLFEWLGAKPCSKICSIIQNAVQNSKNISVFETQSLIFNVL